MSSSGSAPAAQEKGPLVDVDAVYEEPAWYEQEEEASGVASPAPDSKSGSGSVPWPLKTTAWGKWGPADHSVFKVRSATYLSDRVKVPTEPFVFQLVDVEVLITNERVLHWCEKTVSYVRRRPSPAPGKAPPFFLTVNFFVPGTPNTNLICTWMAPKQISGYYPAPDGKDSAPSAPPSPVGGAPSAAPSPPPRPVTSPTGGEGKGDLSKFIPLLNAFINGTDEYRKAHFKFIPRVVDGPWLVKKSVGTQPAILGNKLTQLYFADKKANYMEVTVDVGSSRVGTSLFALCKGYSTALVLDFCYLFEGQAEEELPERILGGVRVCNVDVSKVKVT